MPSLAYTMDFPKQRITLASLSKSLMVHIKRGEDIDKIEYHLQEEFSNSRRSLTSVISALDDDSYRRQFKTLLGFCYYRGIGVDIDCDKAVECFEIAADNEHSYAFFFLALFHEQGISVAQDHQKALDLYTESAQRGNVAAAYRLAQCYLEGGLSVDEDTYQGFHWARKAAVAGHLFGQTKLAQCYEQGHGTEVNIDRAIKWYKKAAESDDAEAQLALGLMYANGQGVRRNLETAFDLFYLSAINGNSDAQLQLALCYKDGQGTKKTPVEFRKWIRAAVENGNDDAGSYFAQFSTRFSSI